MPVPSKRSAGRLCLLLLGAWASIAAVPAASVDKSIYVPGSTGVDSALPTQTVSDDAYHAYIPVYLRNSSISTVSVDALLLGPDGGSVQVVVKQRTATGTAVVAGQPVAVTQNSVLGLDLSATLTKPGDYTLAARILGPDGVILTTVGGKITRSSAALPNEGIVTDPPVTLFSGGDAPAVDVPLAGLADRDLTLTVGALTTTQSVAAGEVGAGPVSASAGACSSNEPTRIVLKRGTAQMVHVVLCNTSRAGDFHAKFDLVGSAGGVRHVNVEVKYACGWYWALLTLVLGGLVGAPLAWWRASGRDQANTLLSLDNLQFDVTEMSAKLGNAARSARLLPLLDAIERCRAEAVADGRTASVVAQLTDLTNRRDFLNRVLWEASRGGELMATPDVETALASALDKVAGGPADETTKAIDALAGAVKAAQTAALTSASMAVATDAGTIDPPTFRLFTGRETRAALLRKRTLFDFAAAAALFLFFCLTAITVLWIPNPVWGSVGDHVVAFIAGAAAFGGLAGQLGTFRTTIQGVKTN